MQEEFIILVDVSASLIRKRSLRKLGESQIVEELSPLLRKHLPIPIEECSAVLVGDVAVEIFSQSIERMKPEELDRDSPERRNYIYLKDYVLRGNELHVVKERMSVSRSTFFEIQKKALEELSVILWHQIKEVEVRKLFNNLSRPPYTQFIERFDQDGNNYVDDVLINELKEGRAWIIAITGEPGIGKSSIAHKIADKFIKNREKYYLPFEAIVWIGCRRDEFQPGDGQTKLISTISSMPEVYDTIGATLERREVLQVSNTEKAILVERLLDNHVCLLIIDNLDSEWTPDEFKKDLESFAQGLQRPHKVIVTLRKGQYWKGQTTIEIRYMSENEAWEFLLEEAKNRRIRPLTKTEFLKVFEKTYGHPLAMKQVLGLTRVSGYPLDDALDFTEFSAEMLEFMYQKTYDRLSIFAKKLLHIMPLFADPTSSEALEFASGVEGPVTISALGRLYRSYMIERVMIMGEQDYGYTLLPFVREYLRIIRRKPNATIENISIRGYIDESSSRIVDYYLSVLNAFKNSTESILLLLSSERRNIINTMKWCWNVEDPRYLDILKLLGVPLGNLRYLEERERLGRNAVILCEKLERYEEANWFQIRDVAWSILQKGTIEARKTSKQILKEAMNQADKEGWQKNKALALSNFGRLATDNGEYKIAFEYLQEANKIFDAIDDNFWKIVALRAMADLQLKQEKLDDASNIYQELEDRYLLMDDTNGQIKTRSSIGLLVAKQGDCEKAIEITNSSVNFAESINPPAFALGFALTQSAKVKEICHDFNGAIDDAMRAQKIYKALGMEFHVNELELFVKELRSTENLL